MLRLCWSGWLQGWPGWVLRMVMAGGAGCCGHGRWPGGSGRPACGSGVLCPCPVPGCGGVLPRRAALRSHQPGSPWCRGFAARVPAARNRARAGCGGTADGFRRASWLYAHAGSSRRREESLRRPALRAAISCGRRGGHGGGAARGGDLPGGDAGVPHLAGGDHGPQPAQQRWPRTRPAPARQRGGSRPARSSGHASRTAHDCGAARPRPRARPLTAVPAGRGGRSGSARPWWPRCARRGSARRA